MASTTAKAITDVATILSVKVFLQPEEVPKFLEHFKTAYDAVIAEPECRFFVVGQNPQEPGTFSWTEGWTKDVDWLLSVQLKKPYYEPYLKATEPMFVKPREAQIFAPEKGMLHFKLDGA